MTTLFKLIQYQNKKVSMIYLCKSWDCWTIRGRDQWDFEREWCVERWSNVLIETLLAFSHMPTDVICLGNQDLCWDTWSGGYYSTKWGWTAFLSSAYLHHYSILSHLVSHITNSRLSPQYISVLLYSSSSWGGVQIPLYKGKEKNEHGVFSFLLEQGCAAVAWVKGDGQVKVHQDWLTQDTTQH